MRIEYYDADTHDLIRRDAYSQALVDALRERDEARAELAEIRRIVTETLPDLADQPDRETTVRRVAALATRYQYERDAAALLRKDVDAWRGAVQAILRAIMHTEPTRDATLEDLPKLVEYASGRAFRIVELEAEVSRLNARFGSYGDIVRPDWIDAPFTAAEHIPVLTAGAAEHLRAYAVSQERIVREQHEEIEKWRGEVERLRAENAVCAVDVEAAAKEIADGFELHLGDDDTRTESLIVAILRKHTRAVEAAAGKIVDDGVTPPMSSGGRDYEVSCVAETLRAAPPSFHLTDIEAASYDVCAANYPGGIDSDRAEEVLRKHTRPIDREVLARAIHAGWVTAFPGACVGMGGCLAGADAVLRHLGAQPTQPTQPVEQVIDLTTTLDEARRKLTHLSAADADHLRVIITRNLRPGFALAQPVEPRPEPAQLPVCARCGRFACACGCEPAKVRVKLPPFSRAMHDAGYDGGWRGIYEAVCEEITKSLREQGVQVDDE